MVQFFAIFSTWGEFLEFSVAPSASQRAREAGPEARLTGKYKKFEKSCSSRLISFFDLNGTKNH